MKQRIIQHLPEIIYRILNGCLLAFGLLAILFGVRFLFAYHSTHFLYTSIIAVKENNTIGEPLFFVSNIERFVVTDMHYEDTLRCGFTPNELFWYSQSEGDYASAPIGKFNNTWKYSGETPTVPMICQLHSLPSVNLAFGINTPPQVILSPFFYFVEPTVEEIAPTTPHKVIRKAVPKPIVPAKIVPLTPPTIQSVLDSNL